MSESEKEKFEQVNYSQISMSRDSVLSGGYELGSELFQSQNTYELVLKHVRNENVFWDGKHSLQPVAVFRGTTRCFLTPFETILRKYVPRDYYLVKDEDMSVVLINEWFQPVDLRDVVGTLFKSGKRVNLFLRSRDFSLESSLTPKASSISSGKNLFERNVSSTVLQEVNCVQLNVQEMSGRKILWNSKSKSFESSVRLVFNRQELTGLKVDQILSNILATGYLENTEGVLEKQIWTDKIKVVGYKDAVDVLFLSANKCNLYLKYINSPEDQQWQEIVEAIDVFTEKVTSTDDELRKFYEDNHVFQDMGILKSKIQTDNRNEEEIERMMKKLEPKMNLALSLINLLDYDGTVTSDIKSMSKSVVNGIIKNSGDIKFDLYSTVSEASGFAIGEEMEQKPYIKPKFWDW
ncbi:unnamed protein product [Allacma fusca]|uniref:Uncharacterized protein n=1 Tax=Allacma fusca TaxID=39272 RepID=A0A8J2KE26_9HEXA|nr:unnamed protein product [Allacma fusca]